MEAVSQFRNFSNTARLHPSNESMEVTFSDSTDLLLEGKVRECDLMQYLVKVRVAYNLG